MAIYMKTLIYWATDELEPVGGPRGYLYNLRSGLGDCKQVDFLPPAHPSGRAEKPKLRKKLAKCAPLRDLHLLLKLSGMRSRSVDAPVDFSQYDIVHFHSTADMYSCRRFLDDFDGVCLLTSHTPCAPHEEFYSWIQSDWVRNIARKQAKLELVDKWAFERADYVLFPCPESKEPYYNTWSDFRGIDSSIQYLYVPTGINGCSARVTRGEVRNRHGVPRDAFVVSYVGRHVEIKGYSDLKRFAAADLESHPLDYYLIAGAETPMSGLDHDRWVEVGWTNDPHSLIAASDVFVLPNRETYFDLIFLEVLSLGVPIVATRTGGNKFFDQFDCPGVFLYESDEELAEYLDRLRSLDPSVRKAIGERNRELFKRRFSSDCFAHSYLEALERIGGRGR